jgi:hypothetical protein
MKTAGAATPLRAETVTRSCRSRTPSADLELTARLLELVVGTEMRRASYSRSNEFTHTEENACSHVRTYGD